jgi:hypothetical protein
VPAVAAVPLDPAGPVPAVAAGHQSPGSGGTRTVTLITGDKVTVGTAADGTVVRSVESPDGTSAGFHRAVMDGQLYVYRTPRCRMSARGSWTGNCST